MLAFHCQGKQRLAIDPVSIMACKVLFFSKRLLVELLSFRDNKGRTPLNKWFVKK
jgi:hypothetical protein